MLIYPKYHGSFYDKYLVNFVNSISLDIELIIITWKADFQIDCSRPVQIMVNPELEYWSKVNDYKEYISILDYAKLNNINRLHFLRIHYESFYSVIANYQDVDIFKITFGIFGQRELYETKVRQNLIKELFRSNSIVRAICHTVSNYSVPPGRAKLSDKIEIVSDPIYDIVESYKGIREKSNSEITRFSFFGVPHFGKGLQIFSDAVDLLPVTIVERACYKVAGSLSAANCEFALSNRLQVVDKFLDETEVLTLLNNTDYLVLPYRKSYAEVTSGVLVQAALSHTPVIVPDIYPFKEIIEEYCLGFVFKCEDKYDLARVLKKVIKSKDCHSYNFDDFLRAQDSWKEIYNKLTK